MKKILKSVWEEILIGLALFFSLTLLFFFVFSIENSIIDKFMDPARNPDEIFSDTAFHDSKLFEQILKMYKRIIYELLGLVENSVRLVEFIFYLKIS